MEAGKYLEAEPDKAFLLNQASRYSIESYQLFLCWGRSVDELWLLLTGQLSEIHIPFLIQPFSFVIF